MAEQELTDRLAALAAEWDEVGKLLAAGPASATNNGRTRSAMYVWHARELREALGIDAD